MTTVRSVLTLSLICLGLLAACSDGRRDSDGPRKAVAPPVTGSAPGPSTPAGTPGPNSALPAPVDTGPVTSPPVPVPQTSRDDAMKKAPEAAEAAAGAASPPPAARENTAPASDSPGATRK